MCIRDRLISIALAKPEVVLILSSQISTQEARTIDWVNIPLKMLPSGANISAKSFLWEAFNPADIPAKRNPSGVSLPSLTNFQVKSDWLNLFLYFLLILTSLEYLRNR